MYKSLHWTQRIALLRHNLHTAHLSHDFTFFKTLQSSLLLNNINHVASLTATLGDSADSVLSGLDDLNASIAHVHQDAFCNAYNSLKTYLAEDIIGKTDSSEQKGKVFVDATMQKQMADHSIDRATSAAITLIQAQPLEVQETCADVWITGTTIVADSVEVCLQQLSLLETNMSDFIRLEESRNTVKASVAHSVAALKGVFSLMDMDSSRAPDSPTMFAGANARTNSFSGTVFRRLSNAFATTATTSAPSSRSSSVSAPQISSRNSNCNNTPGFKTPNYLRGSMGSACPTSLPASGFGQGWSGQGWTHTQLDTIPPTPAAGGMDMDVEVNPFDTSLSPEVMAQGIESVRLEQAVM